MGGQGRERSPRRSELFAPGRPPKPYRFFFGFFCSFFIDVPLDIRGLLDPHSSKVRGR